MKGVVSHLLTVKACRALLTTLLGQFDYEPFKVATVQTFLTYFSNYYKV